jgi:hypothetical protein
MAYSNFDSHSRKKNQKKLIQLKAKTEAEADKERNPIWADQEREVWIEPKKVTVDDCYLL